MKTKKLFDDEVNDGFLDFEVYEDFAKRVSKLKVEMTNTINKLNENNKKIYALGAPVKGTTLLHYM